MYLTLTSKNINKAVVNNDGWWAFVANNIRWERIDDGVWYNIASNLEAIEQQDSTWLYDGKIYKSIKEVMLETNEFA